MVLTKEEIKNYLPHREPFIFVDSVESIVVGKSIVATLYLDPSLDFFKGHFPNNPIMPGVLAVEALAQTSGLLTALTVVEKCKEQGLDASSQGLGKVFYLASNNIKFTNVARAGETLTLRASLVKEFSGLCQYSVEAECGRNKIAGGSLVLADPEKA